MQTPNPTYAPDRGADGGHPQLLELHAELREATTAAAKEFEWPDPENCSRKLDSKWHDR